MNLLGYYVNNLQFLKVIQQYHFKGFCFQGSSCDVKYYGHAIC